MPRASASASTLHGSMKRTPNVLLCCLALLFASGCATTFAVTSAVQTQLIDSHASFDFQAPAGGTVVVENKSDSLLSGELSWEPITTDPGTPLVKSESFTLGEGKWTREVPVTMNGHITLHQEEGHPASVRVSIWHRSGEKIPPNDEPDIHASPRDSAP